MYMNSKFCLKPYDMSVDQKYFVPIIYICISSLYNKMFGCCYGLTSVCNCDTGDLRFDTV